ncbi:MAG TPA: GNAT family N-acetyltransferase [Burkholderiaceae bacterium]|nr:GNAT family N-acetyltransferase [Burkholderiaceae bacterium]
MNRYDVHHDASAQRFELHVEGLMSRADYRLVDGIMHLVHTEVPPQQQGRRLAAALVAAALAYARAHGLKVRPVCSYVRAYMARHPETQDLLAR